MHKRNVFVVSEILVVVITKDMPRHNKFFVATKLFYVKSELQYIIKCGIFKLIRSDKLLVLIFRYEFMAPNLLMLLKTALKLHNKIGGSYDLSPRLASSTSQSSV